MEAFGKLEKLAAGYTPERTEAITGVSRDLIEKAATLYGASKNALVATGMGLSQQVTGTSSIFALLNMVLITGHIGRVGSGINPPRGQNNVQGATDVGVSPVFYPGYIPVSDEDNRKRVAAVWGVDHRELPGRPGLTTVEIMQDRASEAMAGLHYLQTRSDIVTDQIGMWGASQGSWVIALAAANHPEDVAFLISVSGAGLGVADQQVWGIETQTRAAGLGDDDVTKAGLMGRLLVDWQLIDPIYRDATQSSIAAVGPGPWAEFARFQGPASDSAYQPFTQDISAHASSQAALRFISSPTLGGRDDVWFDDIEVQCAP